MGETSATLLFLFVHFIHSFSAETQLCTTPVCVSTFTGRHCCSPVHLLVVPCLGRANRSQSGSAPGVVSSSAWVHMSLISLPNVYLCTKCVFALYTQTVSSDELRDGTPQEGPLTMDALLQVSSTDDGIFTASLKCKCTN